MQHYTRQIIYNKILEMKNQKKKMIGHAQNIIWQT